MIKLRNPFYTPSPLPVDDGLTASERYAKSIRDTAVPEILKTIMGSKRLGMLLVWLVIVVSFEHQQHFFAARGAGEIGSTGLPVIFDLSIIFLVGIIGTTGMSKLAVWSAAGALVVPVSASAAINFVASPDVLVGWAYVVAIGLVAVIKVIKALIKPDPAALREAERSADTMAAPTGPTAEQLAAEEAERARRSEIAQRAAATRRENAAKLEADKATKLADRRQRAAARKLAELAPTSPGHPVVILSAADREALAHLDTNAKH